MTTCHDCRVILSGTASDTQILLAHTVCKDDRACTERVRAGKAPDLQCQRCGHRIGEPGFRIVISSGTAKCIDKDRCNFRRLQNEVATSVLSINDDGTVTLTHVDGSGATMQGFGATKPLATQRNDGQMRAFLAPFVGKATERVSRSLDPDALRCDRCEKKILKQNARQSCGHTFCPRCYGQWNDEDMA